MSSRSAMLPALGCAALPAPRPAPGLVHSRALFLPAAGEWRSELQAAGSLRRREAESNRALPEATRARTALEYFRRDSPCRHRTSAAWVPRAGHCWSQGTVQNN